MNDMQNKSDAQLLREYAEHGTEAAFVEIVIRHTNLVHSAALRQVDSPEIAAEVAKGVFRSLAQAARVLSQRMAEDASLAGWLCRSARTASLNLRRGKFRRSSRERLVMDGFSADFEPAHDWEHLRSVLDDAMSVLSETDESDHDALVLRIFRNQDFPSVGRALGESDHSAQKRVARALDKLRDRLTRLGIATSEAALAIVLSAKAIQAAPAGLAAAISNVAALARTSASA